MSKEWCFSRSPAVSRPRRTIRWFKHELLEARKGSIKWSLPYLAITFEIEHGWIKSPGSIIASELFPFAYTKYSTWERVRQRKLNHRNCDFYLTKQKEMTRLTLAKWVEIVSEALVVLMLRRKQLFASTKFSWGESRAERSPVQYTVCTGESCAHQLSQMPI